MLFNPDVKENMWRHDYLQMRISQMKFPVKTYPNFPIIG